MFIIDIIKEIYNLFVEMAPYLMLGLVFVALLNIFFNKDVVAKQIGKNSIGSIIKASLFGVPLPLCSCGVIPSTVYLARNGASKGSVVSFLISTPQTGIDSIIATYGLLGTIFAIYRPIAAFIMGIIGGSIVKLFDKENGFTTNPKNTLELSLSNSDSSSNQFKSKLRSTIKYAFIEFIDDISTQFILGLIIAGLISYLIPDYFFSNSGFNSGILGMLLMILIGLPMYVCATASIPIAITLINLGFSPGVAFVFLVVGPATNAASLIILFKVLGKKLSLIYLFSLVSLSIIFGYILDYIFSISGNINLVLINNHSHTASSISSFQIFISIIFALLLILSFYRKFIKKILKKENVIMKDMEHKVIIEGMNCNHCVMNVQNAILKLDGVKEAKVILNDKAAYIKGIFNKEDLKNAIENVGYRIGIE